MAPLNPAPITPNEAANQTNQANEFIDAANKATAARHARATTAPTHPTPTPRSADPLVPPVQLTKEQAKIKAALVRGCSSTDVDNVWVDTGQVLKVLALETCEAAGLFTYTVEATETITQKRRPNSIIPQSALTRSKGLSEVNRELLLQLLAR